MNKPICWSFSFLFGLGLRPKETTLTNTFYRLVGAWCLYLVGPTVVWTFNPFNKTYLKRSGQTAKIQIRWLIRARNGSYGPSHLDLQCLLTHFAFFLNLNFFRICLTPLFNTVAYSTIYSGRVYLGNLGMKWLTRTVLIHHNYFPGFNLFSVAMHRVSLNGHLY